MNFEKKMSTVQQLFRLLGFMVCVMLSPLASAQGGTAGMQKDCDVCPELVLIPPGSFTMGSTTGRSTERPEHKVTLNAFYMGRMEVTQAQWKAVMGSTPSANSACGDDCPVESVGWNDVQEYVKKLSEMTGKSYRLPSEAEWEYAARGGTTTAYWWGDEASHDKANFGSEECCNGMVEGRDKWLSTSPVGSFEANAFGLFDMLGNVAEWTDDVYHKNYESAPNDGRAWQSGQDWEKVARVVRGGASNQSADDLRITKRTQAITVQPNETIGFRVVRSL